MLHGWSTRGTVLRKIIFVCFLGCKGFSSDDVAAVRGTVFPEIRPGADFSKTGDFVKGKLGGVYHRTPLLRYLKFVGGYGGGRDQVYGTAGTSLIQSDRVSRA